MYRQSHPGRFLPGECGKGGQGYGIGLYMGKTGRANPRRRIRGRQTGRLEIGKRTGIEIGTEQGTSLLEAAIEDLCAGKTIVELEASGYDQKIIQKAQNIINKHFSKK